MRRIALFGLAALLALPAAPARAGDGIDLGTIVGAGLGGVIGNQIGKGTGNTVATVAGVILGGVAGHAVDQNWNNRGYRSSGYGYSQPGYYSSYEQVNYYRPAPTVVYTQTYYDHRRGHHHHYHHRHHHKRDYYGRPIAYVPPVVREVNYVQVGAPQATRASDRYCREYTNRVVVGNRVQQSYGTACMQPDGSWEVVN